jgi:DNA-binding FadR family transcriptional regulator
MLLALPRRSDKKDIPLEPVRSASEEVVASSVDACADTIRRAILTGKIAVGARLPPERELAARLAVNRSTLRSALARLATERLVTVRQGSGCVVSDFAREAGPELLTVIARLGTTVEEEREVAADLLYVRRCLASAVFDRLPPKLPVATRARLEAEVDRLAHLVEAGADPTAVAEQDISVIKVVVGATKSRVLQLVLNPLLTPARAMPRLREAIFSDASGSVGVYRELLAWLSLARRPAPKRILDAMESRDRETLRRHARLARAVRPAKPKR